MEDTHTTSPGKASGGVASDVYPSLSLPQLFAERAETQRSLAALKAREELLNREIFARVQESLTAARSSKDTGVVRFEVSGVPLEANRGRKVDWDQRECATVAHELQSSGVNPYSVFSLELSVPERVYAGLSDEQKQRLSVARTVRYDREKISIYEPKKKQ